MRIRNLQVNNSRLDEGSYHYFTLVKTIDFGPEDNWYVMKDPMGYKVLMPAWYYKNYGFEVGQKVFCRIDRINCDGKMYLEPMHPTYKEGNTYEFVLNGLDSKTGVTDDEELFIAVTDDYGQHWKVRVFDPSLIDASNKKVKCRLERIKKGKFYLSLDNEAPHHKAFTTGNSYGFLIIGEKINPVDNQKYFILQDEMGRKHLLRKKYYLHYGLKMGQQIICRVDKFTSEGYYFLEPENPWYRVGESYLFKPLEIHKLNYSDGTIEDVLVLDDPHGDAIKTFVDKSVPEKIIEKHEILCRVDRIRKSRLEVSPILE